MTKIPPGWPLPHPLQVNRTPWHEVRMLLLSALAATDGGERPEDLAYELARWREDVNASPAGTLAHWAGTLIAQRVLALQAAPLGYPFDGATVLEVVAEVEREQGRPPEVTFGRVAGTYGAPEEVPQGQVAVRFAWPDLAEPMVFERAPRIPSRAHWVHPSMGVVHPDTPGRLTPDAWRQVPPDMATLEAPRSPWDAFLLARYAPGFMDDGVFVSAVDPTDADAVAMSAAFGAAVDGPPMATPATQALLDQAYGPPVGATDPPTEVAPPGAFVPAAPRDPPACPPTPMAVASVECRLCLAHFVCPVAIVADEVRGGCTTCGGDVGALNVMVAGVDANPRPAREWLPPIQPAPGVEPDTGGPMPYSKADSAPSDAKAARRRRRAAE